MIDDSPGEATLTVIGCAGSVPGPDSTCSCYLVRRAGFELLLDLGIGAVGPLQRHTGPDAIDGAFISHAHSDHCHDLLGLAYLRQRAGVTQRLPVYGPPDVLGALGVELSDADEVFSFDPVPDRLGPWRVRTAVGAHSLENWAIRLDDRLCYTGDSAPCAALDELAEGCQVLLAEAAGFDADRPPYHLTAGDAGRLAKRSGASLLVITHLRGWQDPAELLDEAASHASCPVVLAQPGLRVALTG